MSPEEKMILAARLRAIADGLLVPTATLTGLPPELVQGFVEGTTTGAVAAAKAPKSRKRSAYGRKYKAAFKRVAPKYKLKNGKWKKDGFKRAVREAHKIAGGKKR
ncbi:MAG: hypothetical protein ACPGGE_02420 [Poseidonia sp.]